MKGWSVIRSADIASREGGPQGAADNTHDCQDTTSPHTYCSGMDRRMLI